MTLTDLRYIVALAQQKHFGKAAKTCCVSQPTLSIALTKLEAKLGVTIFERHFNDIRITELGEKIITQAQRVLEEMEQINHILSQGKAQLTSPLKIGAIYTVAPYLLPKLVPKINGLAPKMPLIIQEDFTENLRIKLRRGELDAVFLSLPFSEPGLLTKSLYDESLVILMRKDHPLAKKEKIDEIDLKTERVLLLGDGNCLRKQILEACPSCYKNQDEIQTIEGTSIETLRQMVVSGLGVTIVPGSAVELKSSENLLCIKGFKGSTPQRTIALAWRVSFPRTQAIDVLIQAIKACHLQGICLLPI